MPCKDSTRRAFLVRGGCGAFTLAALGLPAIVDALPITDVAGQGGGAEKRYPIPKDDSVNIDRQKQVIVVRFANHLYAMALACPHESAAVKWVAKEHRFQCTKHDSEYSPDGIYRTGRATRNLDRFPVRRDGNDLVVTTDRVYHSDQNAAAWGAASVDVSA
jgi:Rieske Fe-S protein